MGINFILPLIAGIVMTVVLGTQVAPSLVENMKIAKVENKTISNQNLIKDAIVRYIKIEKKVPETLLQLQDYEILKDYHESNLFDGEYSFEIDKEYGTLTISTIISDESASKYFSNSFKSPNKPICTKIDSIDPNYNCETFYLLDDEIFNSIATPSTPTPEELSPPEEPVENIEDKFSQENLGQKYDGSTPETTLVTGAKDYVINPDTNQVTEYVYNKTNDTWNETSTVINGIGVGGDGFDDVQIKYIEVKGKMIERVTCAIDASSHRKTILAINERTGLGELIWIAPNDTNVIRTKIDGGFTPNNICTSNVTDMNRQFAVASTFNKPLDRWDTSNVTNMNMMFHYASKFNNGDNIGQSNRPLNWDVSKVTDMMAMFNQVFNFNQDIGSWDTSKVTNMIQMFHTAESFNQDLNDWDVGKVTSMRLMFYRTKIFNNGDNIGQSNRPLNWDTSNVIDMIQMFSEIPNFNQDIGSWDVSKVTNMGWLFALASSFNQDLSKWCVTKIGTKPSGFVDGTPIASAIALHPRWGCTTP